MKQTAAFGDSNEEGKEAVRKGIATGRGETALSVQQLPKCRNLRSSHISFSKQHVSSTWDKHQKLKIFGKLLSDRETLCNNL
ncbi:hypothetical protein DV515_00004316 [Chloebia gouldiae]|uniref:Uncharacterized protein n=1 Tax=Chloebia gouldiae TaxID=44316 RepID=A0A3L8SRA6_CHLGU|nr:hypothetical protein DV515_00004316 [Chloebia gouldiae]